MSVDFENIYNGAESDETGELLLEDIEAEISGIFEHIKSDYGVVRLNQALSDLQHYAEGDDELKSFLDENQDSVASEFIRLGGLSESDWQTFKTEQTEKYHSSLPPAESWVVDLDPAQNPEITRENFAAQTPTAPRPFCRARTSCRICGRSRSVFGPSAKKMARKTSVAPAKSAKII